MLPFLSDASNSILVAFHRLRFYVFRFVVIPATVALDGAVSGHTLGIRLAAGFVLTATARVVRVVD
jgi:hypothetical protein